MMVMRNPNHHSDSSRDIKLDGIDFISSLPDAILHDILSYIQTKYAIRTSLLSKRWKRVWHETPSISIDCDREDHVDSIDKTLSSYSAPKIKSFDVSIRSKISNMHVHRLIKLAMSRNTENLSLKFDYYRPISDFFYINSSIKHLRLTMSNIWFHMTPTCIVSWTSLRNLSLKNCLLSDQSIANILSGCPKLESLILNQCVEIHCLDLSRSVNLTRLEITGRNWIRQLAEIVAPHIHYLSLKNFHKPPTLVDVSSLTEANFNIEYKNLVEAGTLQDMVLKLLAKLQNVEKLTIGTFALQILSLAELRRVPFPQLKIKSLTVETMPVRSVIPGIIRLLQNSPGLEEINVDTTDEDIPDKEFNKYLNTQGLYNRWNNLFSKVEKTSWSFNSERVALFMELLMCKASTLEPCFEWFHSEKMVKERPS